MRVLLLSRVDKDCKICTLHIGEHVIGRGTLLECTSKKVSRNHGLIRVTQNDGALLISTHHNPCFYLSNNTKHMTVVKNGTSISINDGDKIALLPDEYWFTVRIVEMLDNENNNKSNRQAINEDSNYNCITDTSTTSISSSTLQNQTINQSVDVDKSCYLKREHSDSIIDEVMPKKRKNTEVAESKVVNNQDLDEIRILSRSPSPDLLDYDNDNIHDDEEICSSRCSTPDLYFNNNPDSIYETGCDTRPVTSAASVTSSGFETDIILKNLETTTSIATTSTNEDNISRDYSEKIEMESNCRLPNEFNQAIQPQSSPELKRISSELELNQTVDNDGILQQNIITQTVDNNNPYISQLPNLLENDFNEEVESQISLETQSPKILGVNQMFENDDILQQNIITQPISNNNSSITQLANLLEREAQQIPEDVDKFEDASESSQVMSNDKTDASNIKQEISVELEDPTDDEMIANVIIEESQIKVENVDEINNINENNSTNEEVDANNIKNENNDNSNGPNPDNGQASTSGNNRVIRDRCWYGSQCYRKNVNHKAQFSHPGDDDYDSDPNDERPICGYGSNCYRKNKIHREKYQHPNQGKNAKKQSPNQKPSKLQKRRKTPKKNTQLESDPEDDYDYSDPFLDDGSSDEYQATSDLSESDDDDDDDDVEDENTQETKRLLREARKFTKEDK